MTDSGGNQNYYMYKGLGSVTNVVDYNGNEKARYLYDAFGNTRYELELTPNVWRYTGEQQDDGTGFYYLRARYYDPFLGRFVSRDPAGAGHPYAYVENNPVTYIDPYGLDACSTVSGLFGKKKDCGEVMDEAQKIVEDAVVDPVANEVGKAADAFQTGYIDIGGSGCVPVVLLTGPCLTGGVQFGKGQGFHPYLGGGWGVVGGGLTANYYYNQSISEGVSCGFQAGGAYPIVGPVGIGAGAEVGFSGISIGWKESRPTFAGTFYYGGGPYIGTPVNAATLCYYVFPSIWDLW